METIVSSYQVCLSVQVLSAWYESVFKVIGWVERRVVCLKCEFLLFTVRQAMQFIRYILTGEMVS